MRLHHVNIAVHPDLLDAEMQFLAEGLGLSRLDPGPELAERARWYEFPDGTQVHLSRTTDPISTRPGHIALDVGDALDDIEQRLRAAGLAPERQQGREPAVTLVSDPGGHMWELRMPD
jgi:catechol 2,3-dioxygenase-like lactoylglutathione lyase family enzyme